MAFMIKLRWDIAEGKAEEFKANQEALCRVMLDHPGVICYHVEYPDRRVSEWIEIYATDDSFRSHLANERGQAPLSSLAAACDKITVRCFGDPDPASREILAGFGTTYFETAPESFVLHPYSDRESRV
jgi:quinol monooxygenase YgiN